jgi:hypothetical protein
MLGGEAAERLRFVREDFDALRTAVKQETNASAVVHYRGQRCGGCGRHDCFSAFKSLSTSRAAFSALFLLPHC